MPLEIQKAYRKGLDEGIKLMRKAVTEILPEVINKSWMEYYIKEAEQRVRKQLDNRVE